MRLWGRSVSLGGSYLRETGLSGGLRHYTDVIMLDSPCDCAAEYVMSATMISEF
jgi:hypothetical protein